MSVLELKGKLLEKLAELEDEKLLREVIQFLEEKHKESKTAGSGSRMDEVFEKAVKQYGNTLQKLAE